MIVGAESTRFRTRAELRSLIAAQSPIAVVMQFASHSLQIERIATLQAGTFYLVVESDILMPEDRGALADLDLSLRANWRSRIIETDVWSTPHDELPLSNSFQVHVVHPDCPKGEPIRSYLG